MALESFDLHTSEFCSFDFLALQMLMTDPVIIRGVPDGLSYERRFLDDHLAQSRSSGCAGGCSSVYDECISEGA